MNFLPIVSAGLGIASSLFGGNKQAKAAKQAAAAQREGIGKGIAESGELYNTAQGFLSPYVKMGTDNAGLLQDIIGLNGPEAQQRALGMYKSSPSVSLLNAARDEAVRATRGQYAAGGLSRSGALTQDLAQRTAGMDLANYANWENLSKGLLSTGVGASGQASNLASNRGTEILGARSAIGGVNASGIVGAANARNAGLQGATGYLQNFLGRASGNDFGSMFGGGDAGTGSWLPTVMMG